MVEAVPIVEPKFSVTLKDYPEKYDFTVIGKNISFSRDIVVTCQTRTDFVTYAEYLAERFLTDAAKLNRFDDFYTNINLCAQTVVSSAISAMIKVLVSNGIFTVDEARFRSHLQQKEWKVFLADLEESHRIILAKEAQGQEDVDKTKNSYRKADTRPEYYGIGGSPSKAYMKSAMGAIGASVVGSMQASALKKELEGAKEFLMNDQEFIMDMCRAFVANVMEVGSWGLTFLGISVKDVFEHEKQAIAAFNNIKYIEDEEQVKALLGSCLIGMPLHLEIYRYISDHFTNPQDRGDLDKVMELLRVNQYRDIDIERLMKYFFLEKTDRSEKTEYLRDTKTDQNKAKNKIWVDVLGLIVTLLIFVSILSYWIK